MDLKTIEELYLETPQKIIDLLDQTATQNPVSTDIIQISLDYAGLISAQFGWSLKDTLKALGKLYQIGFSEGHSDKFVWHEGKKIKISPPSAGVTLHRLIALGKIKTPEDIDEVDLRRGR